MKQHKAKLTGLLLAGLFTLYPMCANAQNPFYKGKTVVILASTAPGGTGDLRARAVVPFLQKYLPGNPTVVIEYMGGGGGRRGANHVYKSVRPDGLTIGSLSGSIVGLAVLGEKGVLYDPEKFIYLGTPTNENHNVMYTRSALGLTDLKKLQAYSGVRIGAQSVGHVSYIAGRLFAYLLNLKEPNFISGYSSLEADAALSTGELDSRANNATSVLRRHPEWLEKGVMNFHVIMSVPKNATHERFADLPEIGTFAKSDTEEKLVRLWRALRGVGSPFVLPPRTPADKVKIVTEAFDKTLKDPEFHKLYKKLVAEDTSPLMAQELTELINSLPRDPEVISLLRKLAGPAPLPPR